MKKKHFAEFYDAFADKAAAKERARKVLKYINKYHRTAKRILELGTGNGNVLSSFPKKFDLYGLDIEKEYLELTRQKAPEARLFVASMHNFKIDAQFDAVFSVFGSINYLRNFRQWEQTFESVQKHLSKKGLFIFDMYTPRVFEEIRHAQATFSQESFGFAAEKGIVRGNSVTWSFKLFEKVKGNLYRMHEFLITERRFPSEKVERALGKRFRILEKLDWDKSRKPDRHSSRILYVATGRTTS